MMGGPQGQGAEFVGLHGCRGWEGQSDINSIVVYGVASEKFDPTSWRRRYSGSNTGPTRTHPTAGPT